MMRPSAHALLALALLLPAVYAQQQPEDSGRSQASWWVQHFGAITASEDPLVARTHSVFDRVLAAADKSGNRLPRLLVVRRDGDPLALAIEDGTIVLSLSGLRRCYGDRPNESGDARAAFVIAHELAHLAKNDFWHLAAFWALEQHGTAGEARSAVLGLLQSASDVATGSSHAAEQARLKELEADGYGLLYMLMAGYDPDPLLGGFLEAWSTSRPAVASFSHSTHPTPGERAALLRAELKAVVHELDFFHFGVRALQLGRYEDAILLLERFAARFPSREVHSNLGLAHYQLAVRALHRCDPRASTRFRLSVEVDTVTLAGSIDPLARSGSGGSCRARPTYRNQIEPAIAYLEHAVASDPGYVPARLNLASAWLLDEAPARALGVLDEVKQNDPGYLGARNDRAVALYLFGQADSIDTMDRATDLLFVVAREGHADAHYNLATIEAERGRHAAARESLTAFLARERRGPWADEARRRLGDDVAGTPRLPVASTEPPSAPPLSIGPLAGQPLVAYQRRPFRLGVFEGEFVRRDPVRGLVLEDFVEIVETDLVGDLSEKQVRRRFGPPLRQVPLVSGALLVYRGFALELAGERARRIVYFETTAP